MSLFGGVLSISGVSFFIFSLFAIIAVGYALGRITIKGVELGTAGVFIIALLYGCFFYKPLNANLTLSKVSYAKNALKVVENLGLVLFVASVGFIAGPKFFGNLKKNFKSYVLLGLVVILSSGIVCAACILIEKGLSPDIPLDETTAMLVGILSGALTSTPAFSAAKEAVGSADLEDVVSVGHGIAYLYGVIGVVLFVQIMPKVLRADMAEERRKLVHAEEKDDGAAKGDYLELDSFGFCAFALAALIGIFVGSIKYHNVSLTMTGGCLIVALIFGHFGHIGSINLMPGEQTLKVCRELGLVLFLLGAGIAGGASFVEHFKPVYFIYGIAMTTIPLFAGYFFARYVLKLCLLNNLGSITGGMTSTPALGTLIHIAGTEDVAAAYACTYPVALIAVVMVSQLLIGIF